MGTIGTWYYVILGIIIVVIGVMLYIRSLAKKAKATRHRLQDFFAKLSGEFKSAWEAHQKDTLPPQMVAKACNIRIRSAMENDFQETIRQMHAFPHKAFEFYTDHPETNRYIAKMYNEFKVLYDQYKQFGADEDTLEEVFFNESEKCICAEWENHHK